MNKQGGDKELDLGLAKPRNPYLSQGVAEQRRRHVRKKKRATVVVTVLLFGAAFIWWIISLFSGEMEAKAIHNEAMDAASIAAEPYKPDWTIDYLTPNDYSRPGDALTEVKNVFVHYTANPGTDADQNRSYFEQLKDTRERSASAHFIIGIEGDIIQCVPFDEIAYAVVGRNYDSISIECCYEREDGKFSEETYESLKELLVYLLKRYNLSEEDLLRHYDAGGKLCPLYFVEHEDAWDKLKEEVGEMLK